MFTPTLLSRDAFKEAVFARDKMRCVFPWCDNAAVDAHHIMERRLWGDGGYYLENVASVCAECHVKCEMTNISVEDVRRYAGINRIVVPEHLYQDQIYDKWGNPIMTNGSRLKGELFDDPSVQKILSAGNVLHLFVDWVKYPRTYHLPWSCSISNDDRILHDLSCFQNRRVIVTEKMDGENTTMYRDHIHARSVDSRNHPSRNWVKNLWGRLSHDIPSGWRICGENLFATHSISYSNLQSYFLDFLFGMKRMNVWGGMRLSNGSIF